MRFCIRLFPVTIALLSSANGSKSALYEYKEEGKVVGVASNQEPQEKRGLRLQPKVTLRCEPDSSNFDDSDTNEYGHFEISLWSILNGGLSAENVTFNEELLSNDKDNKENVDIPIPGNQTQTETWDYKEEKVDPYDPELPTINIPSTLAIPSRSPSSVQPTSVFPTKAPTSKRRPTFSALPTKAPSHVSSTSVMPSRSPSYGEVVTPENQTKIDTEEDTEEEPSSVQPTSVFPTKAPTSKRRPTFSALPTKAPIHVSSTSVMPSRSPSYGEVVTPENQTKIDTEEDTEEESEVKFTEEKENPNDTISIIIGSSVAVLLVALIGGFFTRKRMLSYGAVIME